jgi:hypothetical protein
MNLMATKVVAARRRSDHGFGQSGLEMATAGNKGLLPLKSSAANAPVQWQQIQQYI